MRRPVFANEAKRAWWQVHVDAWRKSGLSMTAYCYKQRLTRETFQAWRDELADWEAQKTAWAQAGRKNYRPISPDKRLKATQAFWAMHVEAWVWSGLTVREYAGTHRLSAHSLRRWRNMIENHEFEIDWRTMLHPLFAAAHKQQNKH